MNANKEISVRKNKVFVKVISMVITHVNVIKISLENSKSNSRCTAGDGTRKVEEFLLKNFLFLGFYFLLLFFMIS